MTGNQKKYVYLPDVYSKHRLSLCVQELSKFCSAIPAALVLLIISWSYYVVTFVVIQGLITSTFLLLFFFAPYHVLFILFLWSFWKSTYTQITTIPKNSIHLPPLPSLREIIHVYGIRAQKQLSQNFLLQSSSINGLVKCAGNLRGAYVLEVGPGPGGITRAILQKAPRYVAVVELDRRFIPGLQELRLAAFEMGIQMDIYRQDILKFNCEGIFPISSMTGAGAWEESPEVANSNLLESTSINRNETSLEKISSPRLCVIGNLPFNISTPLISQWLHDIAERRGIWRYGRVPLTLTFQKEVAERLAADVWDEQRSRLSVMSQAYCDVKYMKDIPGTAFVPPPKVDVGVVRLIPLKQPLIPVPYPYVEKLVRQAFHFRQKQIVRCLETLFPSNRPELVIQLFKEAGVQPAKQCIQLTMSEFRDLCSVYHRICQIEPDVFDFDYQARTNLPLWYSRKKIQREMLDSPTGLTANRVRQEIYGFSQ